MTWYWDVDGWIVAAGVLCAVACALPGCFLVLRRMSMMGDALSHAVLPGLAAAFLISGSRSGPVMLLGAVVVGVLTALLTQLIASAGKVDEGASMGVVFTTLFAIGLVLIRRAADHVDLDPGCVLYGAIEFVAMPGRMVRVGGGLSVPSVVLVLGAMALVNAAFVALFYKELKITSFDPALATTLGINASVMHYLLMTLVAATTVASFEAVGSILVVAMLVVPAAAAHLLTDRLGPMILVAVGVAALSGALGHVLALVLPPMLGFGGTSTAGMMAATAGLLFAAAFLLAPRHGLIARAYHRWALAVRIVAEDRLLALYRAEEAGAAPAAAGAGWRAWLGARMLARRGQTEQAGVAGAGGRRGEVTRLTEAGREAARALLRSHRLWETYLAEELRLPADHTHAPAERLEHVTTPAMRRDLGAASAMPDRDPQGKPIPPGE